MLHKSHSLTAPQTRRPAHAIAVGDRPFPVEIARHPRARRYVLRVTPDGGLRLTVPRGASIAAGVRFAEGQQDWIAREWSRLEVRAAEWRAGTLVWYRGERLVLDVRDEGQIDARSPRAVLGDLTIPTGRYPSVRTAVERHLRHLATRELPRRSNALAAERRLPLAVVSVRNQRSRWGSCSPKGAVALNWRLIQMPPEVADYVILHELAHRRQPNHSARFWREVESLCPWWRVAERWLRKHGKELL